MDLDPTIHHKHVFSYSLVLVDCLRSIVAICLRFFGVVHSFWFPAVTTGNLARPEDVVAVCKDECQEARVGTRQLLHFGVR